MIGEIDNKSGLFSRVKGSKSRYNAIRLLNSIFTAAAAFRFKVCPMDIMETIKEQVETNPIILYMKGSPNQPQCGFSARTVQSLMSCGERFAFVDVLSNPEIRANLPTYANWPTFPQLWVAGELVGGCDIVCEMFEKGELQTLIKETAAATSE